MGSGVKFPGPAGVALDFCARTLAVLKACLLLSEHLRFAGCKEEEVVSRKPGKSWMGLHATSTYLWKRASCKWRDFWYCTSFIIRNGWDKGTEGKIFEGRLMDLCLFHHFLHTYSLTLAVPLRLFAVSKVSPYFSALWFSGWRRNFHKVNIIGPLAWTTGVIWVNEKP